MQHGDRFYVAKWWTSNNQPGGDWGAWELLGDSCTGEEENKEEEEGHKPEEEEETNENQIDNSNKWEHESPNGPPTVAEAEAREAQLTDTPLFAMVRASIATLASAAVDSIAPGRAANPANVRRVESIMSAEQWEYLFAVRDPDYTYRRSVLVMAGCRENISRIFAAGSCKPSASSPRCARTTLTAATRRRSAGARSPRCSRTSRRRRAATTPTARLRSGARGSSTCARRAAARPGPAADTTGQ